MHYLLAAKISSIAFSCDILFFFNLLSYYHYLFFQKMEFSLPASLVLGNAANCDEILVP